MSDGTDRLPEPDLLAGEPAAANGEPAAVRQRLLVVSPPSNRVPKERPVTSLGAVFGRFAEAQQLVGDQVVVLEDSVQQQGQQLSELSEQLPDMKERINWLIASHYDEDQETKTIRERLARQDAAITALTDAVRGLCEAQSQWKQTLDQLLQILGRAQAPAVEPPPRWPES